MDATNLRGEWLNWKDRFTQRHLDVYGSIFRPV